MIFAPAISESSSGTERNNGRPIFILNFHGLGPPPPNLSPEDQDFWLEPSFLESILDKVKTRHDVQITFDDSNETDFTVAFPLLKSRNLTAAFFILAAAVGQPGFVSKDQLSILCREGMRIGSHGMNHRKWTELTEEEIEQELGEAKDSIQEMIGKPVTEAACPFGCYNRQVLRGLRRNGFSRVYTSDGGAARSTAWIQPRNTVRRSHGLNYVMGMVAEKPGGAQQIWSRFKSALKRWG